MNFWEISFIEKGEMWGMEPARSALLANQFFLSKSVRNVLVPGIGYGRNARVFRDSGIAVTGIEISKTAIEMTQKHCGADMTVYHGSITDMPFDDRQYDGVFCHALIHLFDSDERRKFVRDCRSQLVEGGCLIITALSKFASIYGAGEWIGEDRYELFNGVKMYFYDMDSVHKEFEAFELLDVALVDENYPFYLIRCMK